MADTKRPFMGKLLVLRGLPACGKTTYARKFVENDPWGVRVSRDDYRFMMWDGKFSRLKEDTVVSCMQANVKHLLRQGFNVVLDNTHLDPAHLKIAKDCVALGFAMSTKYYEVKDFYEDAEVCIERNAERPEQFQVPDYVIRDMARRWKWPPKPPEANPLKKDNGGVRGDPIIKM